VNQTKKQIGSKDWANSLLTSGIKECKNDNRAWAGVIVHVLYYVHRLEEAGYWWQARRLRNHMHLAKRRRRLAALKELTSQERERGGAH
jgi:hypothetical protein